MDQDQQKPKSSPSLSQRTISSASWNIASSAVQVLVGVARTWLLARWLPVYVFGIYAFGISVVNLSGVVPNFGMGGAFLHRDPETEHEEETARAHFTLKLIFTLAWAALLAIFALLFTEGETRTALLLLTLTGSGNHLTQTPRLILMRRVVHRRLALIQLVDVLLCAAVALGLARGGATLWALLATDIVTMVLNIVMLYFWRPVWRPRLEWVPQRIRYFLRFGSRNVLAVVLMNALDRVDDLWTGIFLGKGDPLGFYSRAYTFATYPSKILATPINTVAGGTYAELKGSRQRLSRAFFRTNAFLVRSGFYLAGLLALIAPEFIRLGLGEKWTPMVNTFRLMLLFTLFDPIKATVANLFIAAGEPEKVVKVRSIQLLILLVGLFSLGFWLGIEGVALAVDLMLVVGIIMLLALARAHVDFSPRRMFAFPALALVLALALAYGTSILPAVAGSDWRTGIVKTVVFSLVYGGMLLALERRQIIEMGTMAIRLVFRRTGG
ncbi:MAG: oligosaccharide flippase family protein [Chloroflexia bacterium]|nr:oligosaccharide flippase family protein [Chloroflexia bacterium]